MSTPSIRAVALAVVATATLSFLPSPASAQSRLKGVLRIAGEHGGDRVAEFEYSDGSTPDVIAGGGLLLTVGGAAEVWARRGHAAEAQVNVGLKYRTIPPATNQDATWLRIPVEGLLFYRAPGGIGLGAGATVHLRNVLAASGAALNDRVEFGNSPGLLLQAEYRRGTVAFDLRYTALQYDVTSGGSGTVDASSIGGGVSFFFGRPSRSR